MTNKPYIPNPNRKRLKCLNCGTHFDVGVDEETHECQKCGLEICNNCGGQIKIEYENNGFNPPDPTHYDPIGGQCIVCGHKVKF